MDSAGPTVALVRRVEAAQAVDLVAEELDAHRKLGAGGEQVHQPRRGGANSPRPATSWTGSVAQPEQVREEGALRLPGFGPAGPGARLGQVVRVGASAAAAPAPRRRHPGAPARQRPAPRRAPRLVPDELAAFVGQRGPWLQHGHRRRIPSHATSSSATRSPISASGAIQQTRSRPASASAAAGTSSRRGETAGQAACRPRGPGALRPARAFRSAPGTAGVACRRGGRTARSGMCAAWPDRRQARPVTAGGVEPAGRGDGLAGPAPRSRAGSSGRSGRVRRQPVRVRRTPSTPGGPSMSPGQPSGFVRRAQLERV